MQNSKLAKNSKQGEPANVGVFCLLMEEWRDFPERSSSFAFEWHASVEVSVSQLILKNRFFEKYSRAF